MEKITEYTEIECQRLDISKLRRHFLNVNRLLWESIPQSWRLRRKGIIRSYGCFLHSLVCLSDDRVQNPWTFFLRNRQELDFIHGIAARLKLGTDLNITVLACSTGMEPYSINWRLKNLRSHLNINIKGVEILNRSLEIAKKGEYLLNHFEEHLSGLTVEEAENIFMYVDGKAKVRPHLKEQIQWYQGDACSPELKELVGKQDIVLANRFLCHMQPRQAEACLKNITNIVADNGYLFVSGIDLKIRKKVLEAVGFTPVFKHLEDIHFGDSTLIQGWPWSYWGLEPLPMNVKKITSKYAIVWQKKV